MRAMNLFRCGSKWWVVSHNNRAAAYLALLHWAAAEADCSEVVTLAEDGPHRDKALLRRALAWKELGKFQDAIADVQAMSTQCHQTAELADELALFSLAAQSLQNCEFLEKLGHGACGCVYQARRESEERARFAVRFGTQSRGRQRKTKLHYSANLSTRMW